MARGDIKNNGRIIEDIETGIDRPTLDHEKFKYLLDRAEQDLPIIDQKTLEPVSEINVVNDAAIDTTVGGALLLPAEALGIPGIPATIDVVGEIVDFNVYIDNSTADTRLMELNPPFRSGAANRYTFKTGRGIIPLVGGQDTSNYFISMTIACEGVYPLVYKIKWNPTLYTESYFYEYGFELPKNDSLNIGFSDRQDVDALYYFNINADDINFHEMSVDLFVPHKTDRVAIQFALVNGFDFTPDGGDPLPSRSAFGGFFVSGMEHRAAKIQVPNTNIIERIVNAQGSRLQLLSTSDTLQGGRLDALEGGLASNTRIRVDLLSEIPNPAIPKNQYSVGENNIIYEIGADGLPEVYYDPGTKAQIDRILALEQDLGTATPEEAGTIRQQIRDTKLEIDKLAGSDTRVVILTAPDGTEAEIDVIMLADRSLRALGGNEYILPANGRIKPIYVPESKFDALIASDDALDERIKKLEDGLPIPLEEGVIYDTGIIHSENGKNIHATRVRFTGNSGEFNVFSDANWHQIISLRELVSDGSNWLSHSSYTKHPDLGSYIVQQNSRIIGYFGPKLRGLDVQFYFTYGDGVPDLDTIPPEIDFTAINLAEITTAGDAEVQLSVKITDRE